MCDENGSKRLIFCGLLQFVDCGLYRKPYKSSTLYSTVIWESLNVQNGAEATVPCTFNGRYTIDTLSAPPFAIYYPDIMQASSYNVTVKDNATATVTVTGYDTSITATPASSAVATASVSNGTITITGEGVGTTTITVTDAASPANTLTINVTVTE